MCEPQKGRGAHLPRFMRSVSENPSMQYQTCEVRIHI